MKNKYFIQKEHIIQKILEYLSIRYEIKKPKKITFQEDYDCFKMILGDEKSRTFLIEFDLNIIDFVTVQIFGQDYKDYYDIDGQYLTLSRRIYQNRKINARIEKIYPVESEYRIETKKGVTYYFEERKEKKKQVINQILCEIFEYNFKNSYLDASIELTVPVSFSYLEQSTIRELLKEDLIITNTEELLKCLQDAIGSLEVSIRIESTKINNTKKNKLETYDGVVRRRIEEVKEEKIEYIPNCFIYKTKDDSSKVLEKKEGEVK